MKKLILFTLLITIKNLGLAQNTISNTSITNFKEEKIKDTSTGFKSSISIRTKKYVGFYWVNGLSTELSTKKIASGSLHLGINVATSNLGSAFRTNAIPTIETELSLIKYFRYSKRLKPIARFNIGFAKAFFGEGFNEIPSTGMLCSIETGFQYLIIHRFSASIYGGYNLITGNGIEGLGTIYPIYSGFSIKYAIN